MRNEDGYGINRINVGPVYNMTRNTCENVVKEVRY
jgi:hypothetical protein